MTIVGSSCQDYLLSLPWVLICKFVLNTNGKSMSIYMPDSVANAFDLKHSEIIETKWRIYTSWTEAVIDPDNGLSSVRCQEIIWNITGLFLVGPSEPDCREVWIKSLHFLLCGKDSKCTTRSTFVINSIRRLAVWECMHATLHDIEHEMIFLADINKYACFCDALCTLSREIF